MKISVKALGLESLFGFPEIAANWRRGLNRYVSSPDLNNGFDHGFLREKL
jgi:hypothetical protein